tara:strand:+ start:59452 stop:59616 length:165 start_codon:yes stop_codon:yes gene_type:complete
MAYGTSFAYLLTLDDVPEVQSGFAFYVLKFTHQGLLIFLIGNEKYKRKGNKTCK